MKRSKPLEILSNMRGVVKAFYLDKETLSLVEEEEKNVKAVGDIAVRNDGFNQALEREHVICIVKDPRFRPPPEPTVILETDKGLLMGIEVFPHTAKEYMEREDIIWLSDGFVVFTDVHPENGDTEYFVMPPVSFPELNESNGCTNVISCSPAPTCDAMIRKRHGMEDDPKLASILVAFDSITQ